MQYPMSHKEKEAIINTFVHSNFSYGCLIWHFSSKDFQNKVEKINEGSLSNDYLSSFLKNPYQYQWRPKDFVGWFMKFSKH